jgi:hypothetical protein
MQEKEGEVEIRNQKIDTTEHTEYTEEIQEKGGSPEKKNRARRLGFG